LIGPHGSNKVKINFHRVKIMEKRPPLYPVSLWTGSELVDPKPW
jgi:hypothetical protein